MTVYIDTDYRCHPEEANGRTAVELSFFDGKCDTFIESYRYIPSGKSWQRNDGSMFEGEMLSPLTDLTAALAAQKEYTNMIENAADYVAAYNEGVESV